MFIVAYKELNVEKMKSFDKIGDLFSFIKAAGPELSIGNVYNLDYLGTVTTYHIGFNGRIVLVGIEGMIQQ
ncbi:hypothetical protein HMPREF3291_05305 [Bacillus sp. HMSC76G11]|nr:hypothetical protein HMPREF3291_05305 [Bacillus sp. HMSC76G11]